MDWYQKYRDQEATKTVPIPGFLKRCILVHPTLSNTPLTESETHETKTLQYRFNEVTIQVSN